MKRAPSGLALSHYRERRTRNAPSQPGHTTYLEGAMSAGTIERTQFRAVEMGMEMQCKLRDRLEEDIDEARDLARLDQLAGALKEVTARRIQRDDEENRDHMLLAKIARELTGLIDQLQARETGRQSAA